MTLALSAAAAGDGLGAQGGGAVEGVALAVQQRLQSGQGFVKITFGGGQRVRHKGKHKETGRGRKCRSCCGRSCRFPAD
jgi:hypothetical protein